MIFISIEVHQIPAPCFVSSSFSKQGISFVIVAPGTTQYHRSFWKSSLRRHSPGGLEQTPSPPRVKYFKAEERESGGLGHWADGFRRMLGTCTTWQLCPKEGVRTQGRPAVPLAPNPGSWTPGPLPSSSASKFLLPFPFLCGQELLIWAWVGLLIKVWATCQWLHYWRKWQSHIPEAINCQSSFR